MLGPRVPSHLPSISPLLPLSPECTLTLSLARFLSNLAHLPGEKSASPFHSTLQIATLHQSFIGLIQQERWGSRESRELQASTCTHGEQN